MAQFVDALRGHENVIHEILHDGLNQASQEWQQVRQKLQLVPGHCKAWLLENENIQKCINLVKSILQRLTQLQLSTTFEDMTMLLNETLADWYIQQEQWMQAAQALQSISLESSHRPLSSNEKLRLCVRLAMLYLEGDDADHVTAEAYLNRAAGWATEANVESMLQLQFKVAQVRVLNYKQKFMEAAPKYLALTLLAMDPEEQLYALTQAVICAILAAAGPARTRILSQLYHDPRVSTLPVYEMLSAVYTFRLLKPEETQVFAVHLQPHQLALTAQGSTLLERAILDHNILVIRRLYKTVTLQSLSMMLHVPFEQAEHAVAGMIRDGRLMAALSRDPVPHVRFLHQESSSPQVPACMPVYEREELKNTLIRNVCERTEMA